MIHKNFVKLHIWCSKVLIFKEIFHVGIEFWKLPPPPFIPSWLQSFTFSYIKIAFLCTKVFLNHVIKLYTILHTDFLLKKWYFFLKLYKQVSTSRISISPPGGKNLYYLKSKIVCGAKIALKFHCALLCLRVLII